MAERSLSPGHERDRQWRRRRRAALQGECPVTCLLAGKCRGLCACAPEWTHLRLLRQEQPRMGGRCAKTSRRRRSRLQPRPVLPDVSDTLEQRSETPASRGGAEAKQGVLRILVPRRGNAKPAASSADLVLRRRTDSICASSTSVRLTSRLSCAAFCPCELCALARALL